MFPSEFDSPPQNLMFLFRVLSYFSSDFSWLKTFTVTFIVTMTFTFKTRNKKTAEKLKGQTGKNLGEI